MQVSPKILVIGSRGQIGQNLVESLRERFGYDQVIGCDLRKPAAEVGPFYQVDVLDKDALKRLIEEQGITELYHLAAILSAKGEENPQLAWEVNMKGLLNVLELGREGVVEKIFWPSSIAVFGPNSPQEMTPQHTITDPTTIYGISKLAGERWCTYYWEKYGVDVRSIRYPGLIGPKGLPGGGTTDYAVDIYHKALTSAPFECFLEKDTRLPMMYMDDAIRATIDIMQAPKENIRIRSSYNLAGMSFSPEEVFESIRKHHPSFQINYSPDYRQAIAESWPASIDDKYANKDWGWKAAYDLPKMTETMLRELSHHYSIKITN
ncbi:MAG: NAD-dependent epimerase/dehydratase family protein [Bacteroidota bacterium]